ncbi:MAG: DUF4249 family protein [Ignavibacteriales bacterium]|nr:DUF4249 family protein [Ignavibacteriales bacterium]
MRQLSFFTLFLVTTLLIINGCDDALNPKGPLDKKMAVYSILSNKSDTQYVRIYATYDPAGFNPLENTSDTPIQDATVKLSQSTTTFQFKDTTLQRQDETRYSSRIAAYILNAFKVQPGKLYTLSVSSPTYGQTSATITLPGKGSIKIANTDLLRDPWYAEDNIELEITIADITKGFFVRFFLDYDYYDKNKGWIEQHLEIPITLLSAGTINDYRATYPRLIARTSDPLIRIIQPGKEPRETASFFNNVYRRMIKLVRAAHHPDDLRMKRVVFQLIQAEPQLYNYYSIVSGFQDASSIRIDKPDYTNLNGALGLFGGYTQDTVSVSVPDTLGFGK